MACCATERHEFLDLMRRQQASIAGLAVPSEKADAVGAAAVAEQECAVEVPAAAGDGAVPRLVGPFDAGEVGLADLDGVTEGDVANGDGASMAAERAEGVEHSPGIRR
ncbi:hypothetical protein D7D52_36925 [Nocardia yunnanensis]|uniref:Uncharacterized protein n=1 Tax=Nocardia yunnanensis TaxID=2382165 RepID=A0A386ZLJ3_9NOCA|nr:hypothetical protein D7D52_36925 [Nocardia yunnanensis]